MPAAAQKEAYCARLGAAEAEGGEGDEEEGSDLLRLIAAIAPYCAAEAEGDEEEGSD